MVKYKSCLVISRHKLLQIQQEDVEAICEKIDVTPELPNNPNELKSKIEGYEAIIGIIPLSLMIQILQSKKAVVTFVMESVGTTDTQEQAEELMSKYPGRSVVLTPSKQGEKFRVSVYKGLKEIKEVKIEDEWLVQH